MTDPWATFPFFEGGGGGSDRPMFWTVRSEEDMRGRDCGEWNQFEKKRKSVMKLSVEEEKRNKIWEGGIKKKRIWERERLKEL